MKFAPAAAAMAAIVAAGSLATPSFAQDYGSYGYDNGYRNPCQQAQHDSGTGGGVLGALAGAVIGSNLAAHSGGRPGGAILGAMAGAAIGNNIGRASAKQSGVCDGADYGRYNQGYYSGVAYRTYSYQPRYGYDRYGDYHRHHHHYDRDGYRGYYDRDGD